jgi:transcriptional regulator with XRE-family HTH domain
MNAFDDRADSPGSLTGEGEIAQDFLGLVGARIRELRSERQLTMQQLADRSQISRRLLTQIEHGQANPSLVAITRIARQLGTDFPTLLANADQVASAVEVFGEQDHVLVWSSRNGSTAHLLVSTSEARTADMWLWRLAPGDSYQGNADPDRSQELFYVLEGSLTITADQVDVEIQTGSASRLRSDRTYAYANAGSTTTVFVRTVVLSNSSTRRAG